MDSDELVCTICFSQFDKEDHVPLMIPKCGHTFCSKCVQDILSRLSPEEDFTCPEDQTTMKLSNKDISEFPQNFALLRLLDKKSIHVNSEKHSDSLSREGRSVKRGTHSYSDKSPRSTQDFSSPIASPGGLTKSGSSIRSSFNHQDLFYFMNADTNICKEHVRKLEVVCLEHKCRICANCALFGSHKNHDIKPEDEVLREIASRAEQLIDVFQTMEKSQNNTVEQEKMEKVTENIKKKCDETVKAVRQKFNEYVNAIRTKERRIVSEIGEKFNKMEENLKAVLQLPQDLQEKVGKWKSKTHDILLSVTEKSEKGEIAFELLEDKNNPKNDLLTSGRKLISDLEKSSESNPKVLDSSLQRISVSFDSNFLKNLETLCVIEVPIIAPPVNIDDTLSYKPKEEVKVQPLKDIMNRSPEKTTKDESISRNIQSYFLDVDKNKEQIVAKSPLKQKASKASDQNALNNDEMYLNQFKLESINDRIGASLEKGFEEDANLLNFEWKDLNPGIQLTETSINYGPAKEEPIVKPTGHVSRKASEEVSSLNYLSREGARLDYINSSGRLSVSKEKPDHANTSGRLSISRDEGHSSRGEKLSFSGKKPMARASSPWKRGGSEQVAKPPRSKKKSMIKVADKFEPIVDGIEQGTVDIADLTGAELGDQGVLGLIEHLKENTTLKSLKLLKNKITDEGGIALAYLLYHNKTLHTINLTQNQLTEKTLDAFLEAIKAQKTLRLKSLYFSQNNMSLRNVKTKLKELAELGVNAIL